MRLQMLVCAAALIIGQPVLAQATTDTRNFDNDRASGSVTVTRDPAAGSTTRAVTATRKSDGATVASTITRTRTENGFTEAGTITGPQGNTLNLQGSVARVDGTLTASRALTNSAGQTVASRNVTATRAANGQVTRTVTSTGPQRLLNRVGRPPVARRPG